MTAVLPSEYKYLAALIDYTAELVDRLRMASSDEPAKGLLEIAGRDCKAMEMTHAALVRAQTDLPTILRAIERDQQYHGKRSFGGKR